MPRARRPSHCPAGTRPAPRARWLSRLLVYSLVRGDQKGNWSRMTHNRCFFQQEQHFWRPRELSLGPSTFAKDPFPGVHAAPHWLAARRPHPGFAPQPQHQAGGQLSPPTGPPAPSSGWARRPGCREPLPARRKGHAAASHTRRLRPRARRLRKAPKPLRPALPLLRGQRKPSQPSPGTWTAPSRQAPSRKNRRPRRTAWSDQKAAALVASASWSTERRREPR